MLISTFWRLKSPIWFLDPISIADKSGHFILPSKPSPGTSDLILFSHNPLYLLLVSTFSLEVVSSFLNNSINDSSQTSGRNAEDMLEEKRRAVCQFVNESVDLMKSQINKRKMEKLSLLGKQREKLEQQMEFLRQGKSTMQTALQELETISFLQVWFIKLITKVVILKYIV